MEPGELQDLRGRVAARRHYALESFKKAVACFVEVGQYLADPGRPAPDEDTETLRPDLVALAKAHAGHAAYEDAAWEELQGRVVRGIADLLAVGRGPGRRTREHALRRLTLATPDVRLLALLMIRVMRGEQHD